MPRTGRRAVILETENGFICSRCRAEVSPHATACPHCGRNLYQKTHPLVTATWNLGKLLIVVGVATAFGTFFVFPDGQTQHTVGLIGLAMGLCGIWSLILAQIIVPLYSGLKTVLGVLSTFFKYLSLPFRWALGKL